MMTLTVHVGWTSHRPIRPNEHWSSVTVSAATALECELVAAQMVACRPECQMVTQTQPVL